MAPVLARAPERGRPPAIAGGRKRGGWRLAMPLAAAASLVIVVMVVASLNRGGPPFRGDVAGIVGTPGAATDGSPFEPGAGSPSDGTGTAATPPSPGGGSTPREVAGGPASGRSTAGTPDSTPTPTAPPTPRPRPTSKPGPTATPAPCIRTVPDLVGARRNDAATMWADAGFTGEVTALPGHGNYAIGSQSLVAGGSTPCGRGVTIGPASE